jgi:hypothetical protein
MLRQTLDLDLNASTATPIVDFLRIAQGVEIGLGVSTYSWMAAFIGSPTKVHMPILGVFDSGSRPDLDFRFQDWKISEYRFEKYKWSGTRRDREWLADSECTLGNDN